MYYGNGIEQRGWRIERVVYVETTIKHRGKRKKKQETADGEKDNDEG